MSNVYAGLGSRVRRVGAIGATAAVAIGVSGALAACGSSSSGGSSPGVKGKQVTVGLNLATSGPYAIYGQTAPGVDAYFKQLNATGGVNGYMFKTVTGDNQNQSAQAASVARQQATTTFTAIGLSSGVLEGAGPVAKATREPLLVGANGSLMIPTPTYTFGLPPVYSSVGDFDADFIMDKLKAKNFGFVYSNDDVGQPTQSTLPKYVQSKGGRLLADVPVSPTQTDYSSTAARLKSSGAKVVLSWADAVAMPQIQKAAAAIGYNPTWVSFFDKFTPSYTGVAGPLAKGVYADNFQYPLSVNNPQVNLYKTTMQKDSPSNVQSTFAQQGWTFAAIVAAAVRKATDGGKKLTRASYLAALNSLPKGPVGLMPTVGFTSSRHYAATTSAMFKWTGSTWAQASPFTTLPDLP